MSSGLHPGLASAALAACIAALSVLLARWIVAARGPDASQRKVLPWVIRAMLQPAAMLEPAVAAVLPSARNRQAAKALESLGLAHVLDGRRWEAVRITHGLLLSASLLLVPGTQGWLAGILLAIAGYGMGGIWLRKRQERQSMQIARELPAYLDLMTVCVEAGATLTSGIRLIVSQAHDSPLRSYLERVLREVRGGRPRAQAFTHVAELYGVESLCTLASALAHAEASGMSLGQVLRTQAEQRTAERFSRAERLAMQAPVKMLGPLIFCIFPCTFIVIAVPIAVRLREALGT